jgi:hypothetical protein
MGLNFPAAPIVGTLYPQPAIPGVAVYRYDGEKWSLQSLLAKQPIYDDGSVAMNAQLTLVAPPVAATDAVAKSYVDSRPPATGALRYDIAQGLTTAQQEQSRQNIYAAPLDAMGYFGLQVNGSCDFDQLNGGAATTALGYCLDTWVFNRIGVWTASVQQVPDAPPGYRNSLKLSCTGGNGAPAPSDLMTLYEVVEGVRVGRLRWGTASAQPLSIAFWAKAHRPGNYGGSLRNPAGDRSYPFPLTINAADTWEYKTVTIPGDTIGTWPGGGVSGLLVNFTLAAGANYAGPPGVWAGANYLTVNGATNGAQLTTDTLQITGLLLLPGIELPSALRAPFTQRFYDDELRACQRYYYKTAPPFVGGSLAAGVVWSATLSLLHWQFPVSMRVSPTCTGTGSGGLQLRLNQVAVPVSSVNFNGVGQQTARIDASVASGGVVGQGTTLEVNIVGSGLVASANM